MTEKQSNPAARADRARNGDCWGAITSESNKRHEQVQSLGEIAGDIVADLATRQAAWISSRYRISPMMARALADLVFDRRAVR
jgi:hypothetical protein